MQKISFNIKFLESNTDTDNIDTSGLDQSSTDSQSTAPCFLIFVFLAMSITAILSHFCQVHIEISALTQSIYTQPFHPNISQRHTYRVSNNGQISKRPSVSQILVFVDASCTIRSEVLGIASSGHGEKPWRPKCKTCAKGEAWVTFEANGKIQCIGVDNLGRDRASVKPLWDVGIKVEMKNQDGTWVTVMESTSGNVATSEQILNVPPILRKLQRPFWYSFKWDQFWVHHKCTREYRRRRPIPSRADYFNFRQIYFNVVGNFSSLQNASSASFDDGFAHDMDVFANQTKLKGRGLYTNIPIQKDTLVYHFGNTAVFEKAHHFRDFLMSVPPKFRCDVLTWSFRVRGTKKVNLDMDIGALMNEGKKNVSNLGYSSDKAAFHNGLKALFAKRNIEAGEELLITYHDLPPLRLDKMPS